MKLIKKIIMAQLIFLPSLSSSIFAQTLSATDAGYPVIQTSAGGFFFAVVAGILLAGGFQLLLTNLLVALGITMTGNLEEKKHSVKPHQPVLQTVQNISLGAGIAAVVTTCIALYAGSYFAVKLSIASNTTTAVTLGLVVWAAYFVIMLYLETRVISSFVGSLLHYVRAGIGGAFNTARNLMTPSPHKQMRHTLEMIRNEVKSSFDDKGLKRKAAHFIKQIRPLEPDFNDVKTNLTELLTSFEVKERMEGNENRIFEVVRKHPTLGPEKAQKIIGIMKGIFSGQQGMGQGRRSADDALFKQTMAKIEEFLRTSGVEALQPEKLKEDINKIVNEPQHSKDIIISRLKQVDPEVLMHAVTDRLDLPEDQKTQIAENFKKTISTIQGGVAHAAEKAGEKIQSVKQKAKQIPGKVEEALHSYLDTIAQPGFSFDELKADFETMLHDPKESVEVLRGRLKHFDRNTLISLLSNNPYIPAEKAIELVETLEKTRDGVLRRAEEVEDAIKSRIDEMKTQALHQAENMRKVTAAAAWWLFAVSALSAGAAALGGAAAFTYY